MRAPGRGSGPALPHNPARRGWGGKGSLLPRAAGEGHCDHSSRTSKSPQICYFLGSLGQPGKKAESDATAEGAQAQGGATTFPGVPQQARDTAKASTPHRSCLLSPDAQRPQLEQSLTQHTPWLSQKACCPRKPRQRTRRHERSFCLLWKIGAWPRLQRAEGEPQARETATSRQQRSARGDGLFISSYYAIKLI